jgi:hypothetical protein
VLQADPPIPAHNLCAMWWESGATSECWYLADMARQISAKFQAE